MRKALSSSTKPRRASVPGVDRAAAILGDLARKQTPASSVAIARRLGLSQSSCYRTLQTLIRLDWIRPDGEGNYDLSEGLVSIVRPLLAPERLAEAARPHLRRLADVSDLAVKLSLRRGVYQVALARVESSRPLSVTGRVGSRFPAVLGASGAAILSLLPDEQVEAIMGNIRADAWLNECPAVLRAHIAACRRDGFCSNIGHHPQGIDTVAAPVRTDLGEASLTIVGLRGDFEGERLPRFARALRREAKALKSDLSGVPP